MEEAVASALAEAVIVTQVSLLRLKRKARALWLSPRFASAASAQPKFPVTA